MKSFAVSRLALLALVCAFALISCSRQSEWGRSVTWKEFDLKNLPGRAGYPDAGAVILLDEGSMEIFGDGELGFSVFEQHRIVKVLTSYGQRFANVVIPYGTSSTIDEIQARTISPDGKITVLDESNIFDVSLYPNFVFFSDQRAKIFTLPAVENGSVIEHRYTISIHNRTFWHSWTFQHDVPTILSRFTLIKPSEWDAPYRVYGMSIEPKVTKPPAGFKSTHVWEVRDVPPLVSEFGMPSRLEQTARLAISPLGFRSWGDVARWYHGLAAPRMACGAAVTRHAQELIAGATTDEEKLKRIYEWVRDKVRYVAVEIGIGGFQPHPSDDIFTNQYGDCKDMTTILCALGREAGIEVNQVLVSTWQNGKPDTSLPSPLQFNHAIAYCPSVGKEGTWLDATEKGCPFGDLPWYDQGLPVLVVGKNGEDSIKTTPRAGSAMNRTLVRWDLKLEPDGSGNVRGETQWWGAPAAELREQFLFMSADARRQWAETYVASRCSGAKLDSFQLTGLDPVADPLTISYGFRSRTVGSHLGTGLALKPGIITMSDLPDYLGSRDRFHPIRFRFGAASDLALTLDLPPRWNMRHPGWTDSLRTKFGSGKWTWVQDGGALRLSSSVILHGEEVPSERYLEFQKFLDDIREKELRELILEGNGGE